MATPEIDWAATAMREQSMPEVGLAARAIRNGDMGPPATRPPYSLLVASYDRFLGLPSLARSRAMLEALVRRYGIKFGSAADLGCGTGLFALYLRRRWSVPVFAVDRSPQMMQAAVANGVARHVGLLLQDIRCLHLPIQVDLMTANFDTINHLLRYDDLQRAFHGVHANLRPGGHFVFDVLTDHQPLWPLQIYVARVSDGSRRVVHRICWLPWYRTFVSTVTITENERRRPEAEIHVERAYAPAVVVALLRRSGFEVRALLDVSDLRIARPDSSRVVFVVRKSLDLLPVGFRM
jgi:SAM-dependent methyltransferase